MAPSYSKRSSLPAVHQLRPLGLGELLDRSVNFWRANWRPLFFLILVFQLAEFTVIKISQTAMKHFFPMMSGGDVMALTKSDPQLVLPQATGAFSLLMGGVLVTMLLSQFEGVAVSHYSWRRLTNTGAPTAADSFRHAASKLWPSLGAYLLSLGWSFIVMLLFMLPAVALGGAALWFVTQDSQAAASIFGILAALAFLAGVVVLVLWFIIRFVLISQILAVEDVSAWRAFRRADQLSSGRVVAGFMGLVKVRLTVLITVMSGVLLLLNAVTSVPTFIIGAFYGAGLTPGHGVYDVVPALVMVPIEVSQTALLSIFAPLYVLFQLFFYADMRMRREGLDLELKLGSAP